MLYHGIDITPVARVREMLDRHGDSFRERCFTEAEAKHCDAGGRTAEHYAGRFAAKEAVLKALGTGWSGGIAWTDVEILAMPGGEPRVVLHGKAAQAARARGITAWAVSISHTDELAIASVIGTA